MAHRCYARLRTGSEGFIHVWVLTRISLDRQWRTAVAVSFAQNGVDGASLDAVVTRPGLTLFGGDGLVRKVGHVEALRLQLDDGPLKLRNRRRNVGKFDDVRLRSLGEIAQFLERIGNALLRGQTFRKSRKNSARKRDVARLNRHLCDRGKSLNNREERGGGQRGRFIGVRVDDGGIGHFY